MIKKLLTLSLLAASLLVAAHSQAQELTPPGTYWRADLPAFPPWPFNPDPNASLTQIGGNEWIVGEPSDQTLLSASRGGGGGMTLNSVANPPPPTGTNIVPFVANKWWGAFMPTNPIAGWGAIAWQGKKVPWNTQWPPTWITNMSSPDACVTFPMEPSSWGIYVVGTAVQSGGCSAGYHLNDFTQPGYMVCGEYTGWSVIVDINFPCPVFGSDAHTTYNTPDLMELVFFGWDYANPPKEFGYSSVIHMPAPGFTGGGWSFEGNPYNSCYLHMISTNSSPVYPPDPGTFHPVIPPSITLPFEWRPDDWRPRGKMPIGLRNVKTNATYTVQSKTGTGSWTTVTNLTPTHAMFGTNVTDYNVCWTTVPLSTNSTDPVLYRFYGTNYNQ